jgi:hypothetical protein
MIGAIVAWDMDDDPAGNVRHIAEHGIAMEARKFSSMKTTCPVTDDELDLASNKRGQIANFWKARCVIHFEQVLIAVT